VRNKDVDTQMFQECKENSKHRMMFYLGDFEATSSTHVALNEENEIILCILQCIALKK